MTFEILFITTKRAILAMVRPGEEKKDLRKGTIMVRASEKRESGSQPKLRWKRPTLQGPEKSTAPAGEKILMTFQITLDLTHRPIGGKMSQPKLAPRKTTPPRLPVRSTCSANQE